MWQFKISELFRRGDQVESEGKHGIVAQAFANKKDSARFRTWGEKGNKGAAVCLSTAPSGQHNHRLSVGALRRLCPAPPSRAGEQDHFTMNHHANVRKWIRILSKTLSVFLQLCRLICG
jgi:hypothetical protein